MILLQKYGKEYYKYSRDNNLCSSCRVPLTTKDLPSKCRKCETKGLVKLQAYKVLVLKHYGNGYCYCCGEDEPKCLGIDHIDDSGATWRRGRHSHRSGVNFYRWLVKQGYPKGFRVACHNCNLARHNNNGICPHQERCVVAL
jgi:hypothetical protein